VMKMKEITKKEANILEFISEFIEDKGYPPTVREIGKACDMKSSSTVHSYLHKLEQKGLIKKDATSSRAISVVKPQIEQNQNPYIDVPVVGLVTAGNPIEAIEHVSEYFPIPASMVKTNDTVFMLTVSGDSMKNVGIHDHDRIIVRQTNVAHNNEIIVALTEDNEATVKRFFKEADHIRLQPENDDYEPIILKDVKIIGKVIGLYRDFM
jgi:repressor LexA